MPNKADELVIVAVKRSEVAAFGARDDAVECAQHAAKL